ncbi:hypothetical protein [Pantoea sp. ME81]|jgi:hypothetical protein|nr:hypothetical protein [Pantoea sp. ME81]
MEFNENQRGRLMNTGDVRRMADMASRYVRKIFRRLKKNIAIRFLSLNG